jgi:hypothetical protein
VHHLPPGLQIDNLERMIVERGSEQPLTRK